MNGGCLEVGTDGIDCETAFPVLMSRYVVNQGCFGIGTDQINCETALPVLEPR